jgi:hypothetical protein
MPPSRARQEDKPALSQSPSRIKPCDAKKVPVSWGFHNRQTDSPLEETTSESIAESLADLRRNRAPLSYFSLISRKVGGSSSSMPG